MHVVTPCMPTDNVIAFGEQAQVIRCGRRWQEEGVVVGRPVASNVRHIPGVIIADYDKS